MNEHGTARYFVNLANLVTAASLAGGFVALILTGQGEFGWAAGVLVVSGVLDLLDGPLARLFRCSGPFGAQLDSLSDMVDLRRGAGFHALRGVAELDPGGGGGSVPGVRPLRGLEAGALPVAAGQEPLRRPPDPALGPDRRGPRCAGRRRRRGCSPSRSSCRC